MSRYKKLGLKKRLAKETGRTKWAPIWIIPRIFGKPKKIHPSRFSKKRRWRKDKTEA